MTWNRGSIPSQVPLLGDSSEVVKHCALGFMRPFYNPLFIQLTGCVRRSVLLLQVSIVFIQGWVWVVGEISSLLGSLWSTHVFRYNKNFNQDIFYSKTKPSRSKFFKHGSPSRNSAGTSFCSSLRSEAFCSTFSRFEKFSRVMVIVMARRWEEEREGRRCMGGFKSWIKAEAA
ncbi:hypothetical protein KQX54_011355 [Cotesia glomerata]|uniref:Uncharacterized protein n=1 Tax=Cotesia glomerata TaxID=32391 RepID=A0AAV7IR00_COTGL|nr:hypothetical protein KQX54_011355 [Cotesia glomerata]